MKKKQNTSICLDILTDCTTVPNILLEYYTEFSLDEREVLFLIELLRLKAAGVELSIKEIVDNSHYTSEEAPIVLALLIEHGFLSVNKKGEIYLDGFFDKMREAWGWKEAKLRNRDMDLSQDDVVDKEFSVIYLKFQEEMGRPLSAIEGDQIKDWFINLSMSGDMIYEALKKAVLLDKRNLQYINKILLDWHTKGYKTPEDVAKGEEQRRKKPSSSSSKKQGGKKYRDDQNKDIFSDVFEVN